MNKKEIMSKVGNLSEELGYIEIAEDFIENKESKYLADYLYGVSEIRKEILDKLSENNLDSEWILIHRVLVRKNEFEKGEFYKLEELNKNIFLARNKDDLTVFLDQKEKKYLINIESEYEELVKKIKIEFLNDKDGKYIDVFLYKAEDKRKEDNELEKFKSKFDDLLKKYITALKTKNNELEENTIHNLDIHLKDSGRKITKTDFFTKILEINKTKISKIQTKFKGRK